MEIREAGSLQFLKLPVRPAAGAAQEKAAARRALVPESAARVVADIALVVADNPAAAVGDTPAADSLAAADIPAAGRAVARFAAAASRRWCCFRTQRSARPQLQRVPRETSSTMKFYARSSLRPFQQGGRFYHFFVLPNHSSLLDEREQQRFSKTRTRRSSYSGGVCAKAFTGARNGREGPRVSGRSTAEMSKISLGFRCTLQLPDHCRRLASSTRLHWPRW
jgi:hypothetical protein